jgi:hypothetical protein
MAKHHEKGSKRRRTYIEKESKSRAVLTRACITFSRYTMAHPFLDTSSITQAEFIANGVRDEVASESIEAGRVGTYENDPKFDQAKAYADVQVPARLPAAMARARDEARARRGQNPGGQANDDRQQAHEEGEQTDDDEEQQADDGGGRADDEETQEDGEEEERTFDDGHSTITAVSSRGTQDAGVYDWPFLLRLSS